jgi:ATP-dependent DNA helicase PIF1
VVFDFFENEPGMLLRAGDIISLLPKEDEEDNFCYEVVPLQIVPAAQAVVSTTKSSAIERRRPFVGPSGGWPKRRRSSGISGRWEHECSENTNTNSCTTKHGFNSKSRIFSKSGNTSVNSAGGRTRDSYSTSNTTTSSRGATRNRGTTSTIRTTAVTAAPSANLNDQQRNVLQLVEQGSSVFFTGGAGVGKSHTMKAVIAFLQEKYGSLFKEKVFVSASTGIAATHINGTTMHACAGIGRPVYAKDFQRMFQPRSREAWRQVEVWIMDEVSMISAEMFDCLHKQVMAIRHNHDTVEDLSLDTSAGCGPALGWDGMQLIFCGDFLQLPPVTISLATHLHNAGLKWEDLDADELVENKAVIKRPEGAQKEKWRKRSRSRKKARSEGDELFLDRGYCFQSHAWQAAQFQVVELMQVYRQQSVEFIQILNHLRTGNITNTELQYLNTRVLTEHALDRDGLIPLCLCARNKDAAELNNEQMNVLQGKARDTQGKLTSRFVCKVQAMDWSVKRAAPRHGQEACRTKTQASSSNCLSWGVPNDLQLCIGSRVILLVNLDLHSEEAKLVNGSIGEVVRWATDRERGQLLQDLRVKQSEIQAENRAQDGTSDSSTAAEQWKASSKRFHLMRTTRRITWIESEYNLQLPVVRFDNNRTETILPELFSQEMLGGACHFRLQLPLKLAWALSIHKSQGMSLAAATIQPRNCFAEGQAYVAISRVRSLDGLSLLSPLRPSCVKANRKACRFHEMVTGASMARAHSSQDQSSVSPPSLSSRGTRCKVAADCTGVISNADLRSLGHWRDQQLTLHTMGGRSALPSPQAFLLESADKNPVLEHGFVTAATFAKDEEEAKKERSRKAEVGKVRLARERALAKVATEEQIKKAELATRQKAVEQARRQAAAEQIRWQAEQAERQAAEQTRRQAAEQDRRQAAEQVRQAAEQARRQAAEQTIWQEQARWQVDEQARRQAAEEQARRASEDQASKQAATAEQARRQALEGHAQVLMEQESPETAETETIFGGFESDEDEMLSL